MNVYLNSATLKIAEKLQTQISTQLGQTIELPYFKTFTQSPLTLSELYKLFDKHIEKAIKQAGWKQEELVNIPILLGSTGYVIADCEARLKTNQPLSTEYSMAIIGEYLQNRYQTQVYSFATSCTSSAQAIYYAYQMLKAKTVEKVLVIGFESFNRLTFEHFYSMHLLSQQSEYLPFIEPSGIILGEALSCLTFSNKPNKNFHCELLAMQGITDAETLTNNNPQSLEKLISNILEKASLPPSKILAVKAHAVGGNFDNEEIQILKTILPYSKWILAKPYLGHTLGASGAVETAFLVKQLQKTELPKFTNKNCNLPLAQGNLSEGYYLNYFLGFGGNNVGWLIKWGK